jgi:hypothetical protein
MLLQLRPIAGIVAVAVTLPLLMAGSFHSSLRSVALPLFIIVFVTWTALFYWLRTSSNADRATYVLCGLGLGVLPSTFFYLGSIVFEEPAPPASMLGIGVFTGVCAGLALCNLSPFTRKRG